MVWWLLHNVAYKQKEDTLTFGQIAVITKIPTSSIKTSVSRFDKKLHQDPDSYLLGQFLTVANELGIDLNRVFAVLAQKGLAPAREREIDGFDTLEDLIQSLRNRRKIV